MAIVYTAPEPLVNVDWPFSVFLGGSIELGKAENWQKKAIEILSEFDNIVILNPRRDDWNSSIDPADIYNGELAAQIKWELRAQKKAALRIYYFAAGSVSPITLLEFGLFRDKNNIIYVDPEYKRRANVLYTVEEFDIPDVFTDRTEFFNRLREKVSNLPSRSNIVLRIPQISNIEFKFPSYYPDTVSTSSLLDPKEIEDKSV